MKKYVKEKNIWIINYLYREGNPLGKAIEIEEIDQLIYQFFEYLGLDYKDIKFDLSELNIIEGLLLSKYPKLYKIDDDEEKMNMITKVTRFLSAYFGKFIVDSTEWVWSDNNPNLMNTAIEYKSSSPIIRLTIGNVVSVFFDRMYHHKESNNDLWGKYLSNEYKSILKRNFN